MARELKDALVTVEAPQGEECHVTVTDSANQAGPIVTVVRQRQGKKYEFRLDIGISDTIADVVDWVKDALDSPLED